MTGANHFQVVNLGAASSGPDDFGTLSMSDSGLGTLLQVNMSNVTQLLLVSGGDINVSSGRYRVNGVGGLSVSRSFGSSVTVNTAANGVFGTPGVGQSNGTVVTGVTLNLTANTFSGGILTT
jgi:hypothetical protein